ncbi:MAG: hypothetical protein RQ714_06825, partial [Nitrosomonas sp.]|nr:hypothetical protein [Nitrosomonas sp.]
HGAPLFLHTDTHWTLNSTINCDIAKHIVICVSDLSNNRITCNNKYLYNHKVKLQGSLEKPNFMVFWDRTNLS